MSHIDWVILFGTLLVIVGYGVYKTYGAKDMESYLKGDNDMNWWTIGLSIMATQASAITFLSTPGQAYADGMRFIQFYFGLPIAMIILSVTFIPIYYKLKIYTAYEYLEGRFDLKTRTLAALLFLVQRGLSAGITIFAPSIILSTLLGWTLTFTNVFIGVLVIIYTVSGGTKAVAITHKHQMAVMMGGMILAGILIIDMLNDFAHPDGVLFCPNNRTIIPTLQKLINWVRKRNAEGKDDIQLIFIQEVHREKDAAFRVRPVHAVQGTWG